MILTTIINSDSDMIQKTHLFRLLFVAVLGPLTFAAQGQIAKWLIPPKYDNITIAPGDEDLIITELRGEKLLWDFNGDSVTRKSTDEKIHPFYRGYAVVTTADDSKVIGFYDRNGTYTFINNLMVAHSSTRFNNGYLLVYDGQYYRFITCLTTNGKPFANVYTEALPFSNHYATCRTYKDVAKQKNEIPQLLYYEDLKPIEFVLEGKTVSPDDINYISSVNDEDIAIVIIKEKVFLFNGSTRELFPVFSASNGSFQKKDKQVKIDKNQMLLVCNADGYHIIAEDPKKHSNITIKLDELERPVSIAYTDSMREYYHKTIKQKEYKQLLSITQSQGQKGLNWGTDTILPPQFRAIGTLFDDKAIVCLNGRWGLIQAVKGETFDLKLNKGRKLGLRHSVNETDIQLTLPKGISPQESLLEIVGEEPGCSIDPLRAERHGDGNQIGYITYPCMLDFPSNGIPDTYMEHDIDCHLSYNARVVYNELRSPVLSFTADVWHDKYITPDIPEADSYFQDGKYHFTLLLNSKEQGQSYSTHVEIKISNNDTTATYISLYDTNEIRKVAEDKYDITLPNIAAGTNSITVVIVEDGGLETEDPFEVFYEKQSKKSVEKVIVKPRYNSNRARKAHKRSSTTTPNKPDRKDIGSGYLYD